MNKFFINKQLGIKQSVIDSVLVIMGLLVFLVVTTLPASAKQYVQSFQNNTTTLSGQAVQANMYFVKMGYWQVDQATLNLNFQVSQLTNRQTSDITVAVNGITFDSFRPQKTTGMQTRQIIIPKRLIQSQNNLKVSGQLLNQAGKKIAVASQTPANWLTLDRSSNVNFDYRINEPDFQIRSYYAHLTGADTLAHHQSAVLTPSDASDAELAASTRVLMGLSRFVTSEDQIVPMLPLKKSVDSHDYQVMVARADHLPASLKRQVSVNQLRHHAVIKCVKQKGRQSLLVTASSTELLNQAAKYVANQELMQQTKSPVKLITKGTRTTTSVQHFQNRQPLTMMDNQVTGTGRHVVTYFVQMPNSQTNAIDATINLDLRYAQNLNFKQSMVTIKVNDQTIGSRRLRASHANGDHIQIKLPAKMALPSTFTVQVIFDLVIPGKVTAKSRQTPWATVLRQSYAKIPDHPGNTLLFNNYPTLFMADRAVKNMALIRPQRMTDTDFATLTNLMSLIGTYAKQNTGQLTVYHGMPSRNTLTRSNVITFGTPQATPFIGQLNSNLYFQFNHQATAFNGNEKLSLESEYAKHIGTAQLLRSPYNSRRGLLVVTGPHRDDVYRASTQLNRQINVAQYPQTDAIVVDEDNQHFSYRFKKRAVIYPTNFKAAAQHYRTFWLFVGVATVILLIFGFVAIRITQQNGFWTKGDQTDE